MSTNLRALTLLYLIFFSTLIPNQSQARTPNSGGGPGSVSDNNTIVGEVVGDAGGEQCLLRVVNWEYYYRSTVTNIFRWDSIDSPEYGDSLHGYGTTRTSVYYTHRNSNTPDNCDITSTDYTDESSDNYLNSAVTSAGDIQTECQIIGGSLTQGFFTFPFDPGGAIAPMDVSRSLMCTLTYQNGERTCTRKVEYAGFINYVYDGGLNLPPLNASELFYLSNIWTQCEVREPRQCFYCAF